MPVIRKFLTPLELMPSAVRYDETNDVFQRSPDGGTTWIDDPAADPRHNPAFQRPADPTADPECDAAARLVHLFQDSLTVFFNSVSAAQYATFVMSTFLALTPGIGILAGIALILFDTLISIGTGNIEAAFTAEVWESITCIIRCRIGSDGQVSVEERDSIMAAIQLEHPGTVYNTLINVVNLFGEVLMSNAAVEYTDTGDCDECDECGWCYSEDLTAAPGLWSLLLGQARGEWVEGTGWATRQFTGITLLQLQNELPAGTYTSISFMFNHITVQGGSTGVFYEGVEVDRNFTTGSPSSLLYEPVGGFSEGLIDFQSQPGPVANGGTCHFFQVIYRGTGSIPAGMTNNC